MPHDLAFTVNDDGTIRFVYHPNDGMSQQVIALVGLQLKDCRAGYVLPEHQWTRRAFRCVRKLFGSKGKTANWTRRWSCRWVVVDAQTMEQLPGVYPTHDAGVEAEVAWSLAHGFPRKVIE